MIEPSPSALVPSGGAAEDIAHRGGEWQRWPASAATREGVCMHPRARGMYRLGLKCGCLRGACVHNIGDAPVRRELIRAQFTGSSRVAPGSSRVTHLLVSLTPLQR